MDQEPVPSNSPLGQALVWVSRITVIGLQMVVPGVVGGYADRAWGTSFLAPIGFVLGFIFALWQLIAIGNQALINNPALAQEAYREAMALHKGAYLPDRIYEDWSCDERERLQVLALGAIITLAELILQENPMESIRLSQQALLIDAAWEDAYRIQMEAYFLKGNRPMAIKTYQQCEKVLKEEMAIQPLPETKNLYRKIMEA